MNARPLVPFAALALTLFGATAAQADEESLPAWQEPGYVMEVVIAKGTRPSSAADSQSTSTAIPAWQEPGYVEEVVIVKASRSEALARAAARRVAFRELLLRTGFLGLPPR